MKKEQPNYYAIIPANVRYSSIEPGAKLLYGEITALCSKEGFCWASNSYFAKLYGVGVNTISAWVKSLIDSRFITSSIDKGVGNKRKIIAHIPILENHDTLFQKIVIPITKNASHNNTMSITSNILHTSPSESVADLQRKIQNKQGAHRMAQIVIWAEERRGKPFVNKPKQFAAIKRMKIAGLKPNEIQDRWEELEQDRFYSEKGFDFVTIANSFDKK